MTQLGLNPFYFAWMQLFFAKPEQIVIKVEIFELTLGMEIFPDTRSRLSSGNVPLSAQGYNLELK